MITQLVNGIRKVSRSERRARNNLGVVNLTGTQANKQFRKPELERYDAYYESRQYDHLMGWDSAAEQDSYVAIRRRKPRFKVAFAKTLAERVVSKLLGDQRFPMLEVADSPDDQAFLKAVIRESKLKSRLLEPMRRCVNAGSIFVRFYLSGGAIRVEWYSAKVCYPFFGPAGELELLTVKYTYEDQEDKDAIGNPRKKWFRMDFGTESEILYDNPLYVEGQEPEFQEVARVDHGFGFVQGEWFRTAEIPNSEDGYGLVADLTEYIDELCYSLSQSSQAVSYNQDPQLTLNGMDEEEIGTLIRSAMKSWNLGREGEAKFLESNLAGVERAIELRDKVRLNIQDISRVVLLDPEKIVGNAQSAKAMETLHGPLVDLVNELRAPIGDSIKSLVLKMAMAVLIAKQQGLDVPMDIPAGYAPKGIFAAELVWNPIFQETMEDLQKKVQVASTATSANIISRATATRWLAKDFGIEDVEAELAEIAKQPILNPFGSF